MHARKKREPKHERAKKGIENEIALTYFSNSAVWFHFNAFLWVDLLVSVFSERFFFGVQCVMWCTSSLFLSRFRFH
jgi:hypothetical protein